MYHTHVTYLSFFQESALDTLSVQTGQVVECEVTKRAQAQEAQVARHMGVVLCEVTKKAKTQEAQVARKVMVVLRGTPGLSMREVWDNKGTKVQEQPRV
eukprot:scaffold72865_cov19-Tisochrysis_lutea.AAC.1